MIQSCFCSWHQKQAKGFTLIEVLTGMLLMSAFLGAALQSMVLSTALKVKSQDVSETITWIQEDLERLRYEANRLHYDADLSSYADPDHIRLCSATGADLGYGNEFIKDALNNQKVWQDTKNSVLGSRQYQLTRTVAVASVEPFNIVNINYKVNELTPGNIAGDTISELYAEVIPNASLACP